MNTVTVILSGTLPLFVNHSPSAQDLITSYNEKNKDGQGWGASSIKCVYNLGRPLSINVQKWLRASIGFTWRLNDSIVCRAPNIDSSRPHNDLGPKWDLLCPHLLHIQTNKDIRCFASLTLETASVTRNFGYFYFLLFSGPGSSKSPNSRRRVHVMSMNHPLPLWLLRNPLKGQSAKMGGNESTTGPHLPKRAPPSQMGRDHFCRKACVARKIAIFGSPNRQIWGKSMPLRG